MNPDRPWLQSYPQGVPAEIDPDQYRSIAAVFDATVARFGDRPAYRNFGKTLTYSEVDALATQFAAYLIGELGLKKGDRVALMMPNCLQYPIATFGILRAGLTVVNVNPLYTARELRHQLVDAGAAAIVVVDNFGHTVQEVLADTPLKQVITTGLGDMLGFPKGALVNFVLKYVKKMVPDYDIPGTVRFRDALAAGRRHTLPQIDIDPSDIAFLQYTGGTTGVAKGAMLTHRNLVANMRQASAWLNPNDLRPGEEVIITALPLYHIFALTANGLVFMELGGLNHLITNPRDMPGFVKELKTSGFTAITGVNTLFNGLLNTPGFDQVDFSRLKITLGGGMAVQRAVAERWKKVTGVTLVEAYGLTETSPAACINPLDIKEFNGSIGLPIPSTDVCVKDDDGREVALGEIGELCIRGPQVMKGYWQRQEETARTIDADGWLHTGDMARIDEQGFVYIVDRKKDMVISGGFNVYPSEVEAVLYQHAAVAEACVFSVPDDKWGEAVAAHIVLKPGASPDTAGLDDFCAARLAGFKRPRRIEFVESLLKNANGKVARKAIQTPYWAGHARRVN